MKYFEEKKLLKKCGKNDIKVGVGKMKIKTNFVLYFKWSLNFRAHAFKIERAFEKRTKSSRKVGPKRTIIRQL